MSLKQTGVVSVSVTSTTGTYKDLADFNFACDGWSDVLTGPVREYVVGSRPGRIDAALLDSDPRYKPGDLAITGTVCSDDPAYTMALLVADVENLKGWVARCVALKVTTLKASAFLQARLVSAFVSHFDVPGRQRAAKVALAFQAVDPLWYSTTETSNNLTTSLTEQTLGTAPSRPVIRLTGALSAPTITYADSAGATVQTMVLDIDTLVDAADYVEIDMAAMTIVKSVNGTVSNAVDTLVSGDFFALDPADSDTVAGDYCQVKYAATGTVASATCKYRAASF